MEKINVERLIRNVAIGASLIIIASQVQGCTMDASVMSGPDFVMRGNAAGIRAFYDGNVGQQKTAKESPDAVNQHMQYRAEQEREVTKRENHSFLSDLFAPSTKSSATATAPEASGS